MCVTPTAVGYEGEEAEVTPKSQGWVITPTLILGRTWDTPWFCNGLFPVDSGYPLPSRAPCCWGAATPQVGTPDPGHPFLSPLPLAPPIRSLVGGHEAPWGQEPEFGVSRALTTAWNRLPDHGPCSHPCHDRDLQQKHLPASHKTAVNLPSGSTSILGQILNHISFLLR